MTSKTDTNEAALFAFKVWRYKEGQLVSLMMHIGDRLGIYAHMSGRGAMSANSVATEMLLQERWVLEWLRGQAAAGLLERNEDDTYELTDVGASVLADETTSLLFAAGALASPHDPRVIDQLVESFKTGQGLSWNDHGNTRAENMDRTQGLWTRLALVDKILPSFPEVVQKLESGIDVLEIGCGAGAPIIELAKLFPNSRFLGVDPSNHAVKIGNQAIEASGLGNVTLQAEYGETFSSDSRYDFIMTFDCLHDMPRPDLAMENIRKHISENGTWLIKDIRCSETFEENRKIPVLALMYGFSVTGCLPSSLSQPDGLGLGTLGLPAPLLKEMITTAGFTSFKIHDFEEPANLYYEVRP